MTDPDLHEASKGIPDASKRREKHALKAVLLNVIDAISDHSFSILTHDYSPLSSAEASLSLLCTRRYAVSRSVCAGGEIADFGGGGVWVS